MLRIRHTSIFLFFFNDTATTEIYTLSLHDALPISDAAASSARSTLHTCSAKNGITGPITRADCVSALHRSEEHTSELQSRSDLVCRLLLEKKKKKEQHLLSR